MPSLPSRRSVLAGGALAVPLVLVGCSPKSDTGSQNPGSSPSASDGNASQTPSPTPPAASVSVTSQHALDEIRPTDTLTFKVTTGTLASVAVTNADGDSVDGTLSDGVWTPKYPFRLNRSYTVVSTLQGAAGSTKVTTPISTLDAQANTAQMLYSGAQVGAGMPVIIKFANEVVDADQRKAIQQAMTVTTTPQQTGAWGWIDNAQLMWRPEKYWLANSKVSVEGKIAGLATSSHRFLTDNLSGGFTVGGVRILYVDIKAHTMKVTENGKTVKTIPITTGKDGFITRSGTKVIIERDSDKIMDSTTIGIPKGSPDYYRLDVKWAMRVTYTGEFIHAAPWSEGQQGSTNVSHGCVGLSMANGKWLFNLCRAGDIVVNTGSNRNFKPSEGIGCWVYDWKGWQGLSAV